LTARIIEATELADIEHVASLFDTYRESYGEAPDLGASCTFLRERWIARESVVFIATDPSSEIGPLGFANLYPLFFRFQRAWLLNDLYVRPEFRRRGIARMLLQRAEKHARETNSAGIVLSTDSNNHAAQRLYDSEGFGRERDVLHYSRYFKADT
jgi:ribosomal protein S18 acetylase RimI-like enzyme